MADTAVQTVIQLLTPLITAEISLISGLPDNVRAIKDELESISAFLKSAEERVLGDEGLKTWVRQVRTLAYDIEDVIEKYQLFQKETSYGKAKNYMLLRVRSMATTIKSIRQRAVDIPNAKDVYRFDMYRFNNVVEQGTCSSLDTQSTTSIVSISEESELVGVETPKGEIIELLDPKELHKNASIVAVVGMRGLGKTTVVYSIYNDPKIRRYFPQHAWISVSRTRRPLDILKSLVEQFYVADNESKKLYGKVDLISHFHKHGRENYFNQINSMDQNSLQDLVRKYMKNKRYMVVIDDVQDCDGDRELAIYIKSVLPTNSNKGSKIVMTTRYENVARTWLDGSNHGLYKLKPLTPEKAWDLFCKKAFQSHRGECPSSLHDLARNIVKRCEGLPLIISEMGCFLSKKLEDQREWKKVSQSLGFYLQQYLTGIHNSLIRDYHSLPSHLKPCFLYFGLFPKGYPVNRMQLIRLWIAEGFIGRNVRRLSCNLTLEEVAEEYINQLISMSLVEVDYRDAAGKPKTLKVCEFLHEMILSKVTELDFCQTLPEKNSNIIDLSVEPRRLSIHIDHSSNAVANPATEIIIGSKSNIRSLLLITDQSRVQEKLWPKVLPKALNNNRLLKVLDLCNAPIDELPKEVGKLLSLQYLSLRKTRVKRIPNSIVKLQDLQTLDLKQTLIRELPAELNELHKLRHLLTYRYEYDVSFSLHTMRTTGVKIPNGALEKYGELQKLAFVDVEHKSLVIKELSHLRQLRKLGITGLKSENGKDLCAAIEKMEFLEAFSVYSKSLSEFIDLDHFQSPPSTLKRLYLNGPLMPPFSPSWILELHCLVKIRLRWSCLEDVDPLGILETLPSLVELQLLEAYYGDSLKVGTEGFKKLKILQLLDLQALESLSIYKGALPVLQGMEIGKSPRLQVPLGIKYLPRLETLTFYDTPLDFDSSLQEDGQYHSIVKHVPNVRFQKSDQYLANLIF